VANNGNCHLWQMLKNERLQFELSIQTSRSTGRSSLIAIIGLDLSPAISEPRIRKGMEKVVGRIRSGIEEQAVYSEACRNLRNRRSTAIAKE